MTKERFDQLAELGSRIAAEQDRQEMGAVVDTRDRGIERFHDKRFWDKAEHDFQCAMNASMAGTKDEELIASKTIAIEALAKIRMIEDCLPSYPMTALKVLTSVNY